MGKKFDPTPKPSRRRGQAHFAPPRLFRRGLVQRAPQNEPVPDGFRLLANGRLGPDQVAVDTAGFRHPGGTAVAVAVSVDSGDAGMRANRRIARPQAELAACRLDAYTPAGTFAIGGRREGNEFVGRIAKRKKRGLRDGAARGRFAYETGQPCRAIPTSWRKGDGSGPPFAHVRTVVPPHGSTPSVRFWATVPEGTAAFGGACDTSRPISECVGWRPRAGRYESCQMPLAPASLFSGMDGSSLDTDRGARHPRVKYTKRLSKNRSREGDRHAPKFSVFSFQPAVESATDYGQLTTGEHEASQSPTVFG